MPSLIITNDRKGERHLEDRKEGTVFVKTLEKNGNQKEFLRKVLHYY